MKHFVLWVWSLLFAATAAFAQSGYTIQPGDTLAIEVLEDNALNRSVLVLPDGSISFPFAGNVAAGGRTVSEVEATLTRQLASNFASPPTVFVTVRALRPDPIVLPGSGAPAAPEQAVVNVYFLGEVNGAGLRPVMPGTTFLQGISQAGGFTQFAATKRIQLRRTDPRTGAPAVYLINYRALSLGAKLTQDVVLQEGDVILVPERRLFE